MQTVDEFIKDLTELVIVKRSVDLGEPYDLAIMAAVKKLKSEIQKQGLEQDRISLKRQEAIDNNLPQELIDHLDEFSGDCVDNEILLKQQMAVIAEMRLVYLYKSFEIALKEILHRAYRTPANDIATADLQSSYLNSKGIVIKKIAGFKVKEQLRIIVNNIKHGTELNRAVKRIPEFKNSQQITFEPATKFYERISPIVNHHLEIISEQVFKTLYP